MNQKEFDEFNQCIEVLASGGTIQDCIEKIPGLSPEVLMNLQITRETMELGNLNVPTASMDKSLAGVLAKSEEYRKKRSNRYQGRESWLENLRQFISAQKTVGPLAGRLILVLGITVLLIALSGGLVITSAKSIPGDSLYPVKRAVEDIQVYLNTNPQNRLIVEEDFNQKRVGEVRKLLALNRVQKMSFEGVVEAMSNHQWVVSGIVVNVLPDTVFGEGLSGKEKFSTGSIVEIEGMTNSSGGVNASEIHLRQYQLDGIVEKIDATVWQISGNKIPVNSATKIEAGIQLGNSVVVVIHSQDDGYYALSIQNKSGAAPLPTNPSPQLNTPVHEQDATEIDTGEQQDPEETISPETSFGQDLPYDDEGSTNLDEASEDNHTTTPTPDPTSETTHGNQTMTPEHNATPEPSGSHD